MNFTWKRFFEHLKPVAVFLAALIGFLGFAPKLALLSIVIWQILTRGATLWSALVSFFTTIYGWLKRAFNK